MSPPPTNRRVAITGIGLVTPIGSTLADVFQALLQRVSGVRVAETLAAQHLPSPFAAEATQFTGHIDDFGGLEKAQKKAIKKGIKLMCRETQMGVAAAQHALDDAKSQGDAPPPERCGVVFGSDYMLTMPADYADGIERCGGGNGQFEFDRWGGEGLGQMSPLWLLKYLPNMPASHIAIYNDLRGPNNSLTHREAAGLLAIAEAARTIRRGHADRMIAGATGTRVHPMKAIHAVQQQPLASREVPPAEASRPFDLNRTGMVLGEGAAAMVLEEYEAAAARGATIYAEVTGSGAAIVASGRLEGNLKAALASAMRTALASAAIDPAELGHISAHGLGTVGGDEQEAAAIVDVCGDAAAKIPVAAAKSFFGNLGAASGVVELAASLASMRAGQLYPTLNYERPDPRCPLRVIGESGIEPGRSCLAVNVTPQGQAAAVIAVSPPAAT